MSRLVIMEVAMKEELPELYDIYFGGKILLHYEWKQIKKELSYRANLEKVILDGDRDITEAVKELEKQELRNIDENWNLPF